MSFLQENWMAIVVALLALSEVLAQIPSIKANSVFQLFYNSLKKLAPSKKEKIEELKP